MSWLWANLGLGPKKNSFIQGQTLIGASNKHGKKNNPIWANLDLGPKQISFIQGQTLIIAKAPHGG